MSRSTPTVSTHRPVSRHGAGSSCSALPLSILDELAELAASGLTTTQIARRPFLSPRTVSGHLAHAFLKLGITSRAALRDALSAPGADVVQ